MTTATQTDQTLIRDLLCRFIDHPKALRIMVRETQYEARWTMQCHADDHSKMVGKGGAHFYAIRCLLTNMGIARDLPYILNRYLEPEPAPRQPRMPTRTATNYDMTPAKDMLVALLGVLPVGETQVEAERFCSSQGYELTIFPREIDSYNTLTIARPEHPDTTLVGAIGTLYRAWARRDGVVFDIEVERP